MDDNRRTGGCLCGDVRYSVPAQAMQAAVCHCRNCQKQAGTAFSVIVVYRRDDVTFNGTPSVFEDHGDSGQPVWRHFCGRCGSPLYSDSPAARDQGVIYLKAGTLDDVSDLSPSLHVWTRSKQPWLTLPDAVKQSL